MKRFILAPDSFKGTMSAGEICTIMAAAIRKYLPSAHITSVPLADGGEEWWRRWLRLAAAIMPRLT